MKGSKISNPEKLPIWLKSHQLTLVIYKVSSKFPKHEQYGLSSQIRRSSSSIPANISEGFYRKTTKELLQFLYNARGSYGETLYHLRLSKDLGYLSSEDYNLLTEGYFDVGKQLNGWISSLKKRINH